MAEKTYVVDIRDLEVEYRTDTGVVHALNGFELQLEKGKTLGLVGDTGAGKTTASAKSKIACCHKCFLLREDHTEGLYCTTGEAFEPYLHTSG